ncbi:MAG: hypothetical protein AMXMBFR61_04760 [Fimbriimonadales bacterium]
MTNKLTNWACWVGVVLSLSLLAARIASAGGLRICDCSGAVLVGATLIAFMPPIAGIGYFVLQLFARGEHGIWQRLGRFCTFCGLPVAVVALNSMAVGGMVCPLCLGVWTCFAVIAVATVRQMSASQCPTVAARSVGAVVLFLAVGLGWASIGLMLEDRSNCRQGHRVCELIACAPWGSGMSYRQLANHATQCINENYNCYPTSCQRHYYYTTDCTGEYDVGQVARKRCELLWPE